MIQCCFLRLRKVPFVQNCNTVKEIQYNIKKNLLTINFIYERSNKEAGVDDQPV